MKKAVLLLIFSTVLFGLNAQKSTFKPEVYTLANGLTIYLNPDPNSTTVYGLVVVKAGSKNDPADATGLAHYQEHMLFKGTEDLGTIDWEKEKVHIDRIFKLYDDLAVTTDPEKRKEIQQMINDESVEANKYVIPNELDKLLKSIGSTGLNAFTSFDMTAYFNEFPPSQIEKWLEIYSHRFMNPVFRGFQAELEVVYEEYNMYNDMFFMALFEDFGRNFYKTHPYGQQTTIGTFEHLKNPSLTKMYKFFKTWYVPNNMALVLSGNFNKEAVKPMIQEYFGRWKSGILPEFPDYPEVAFNGRELVEVKMSPVKLGILGFRTAPAGHQDIIPLEVLYKLLSNSSQTGVLDKLMLDNKLMAAQAIPMPYKDHGALLILIVPKIVGQSLEDAEQLVMTELKKIAAGEFNDEMIEAIKKEMYIDYARSLESPQSVTLLLAQSFVNEEQLDEMLVYPDRLKQINRSDIERVAKTYIGDNYLAFFSTMGFPKKEKIEKPGYEPIVSNTTSKSAYYEHIESWHPDYTGEALPNYFEKVETHELSNGSPLYFVENPYNDIFTFEINFYLNSAPHHLLSIAVRAMNLAGTGDIPLSEIKERFALLGVSYSFYFEGSVVTMQFSGLEESFSEGFGLMIQLLKDPKLDQSKISLLYEEEKTGRKLETAEAENISEMLFEWALYGELSSYINRPSLKEVKKLKADELEVVFKTILNLPFDIHYVGNRSNLDMVKTLVEPGISTFTGGRLEKLYERPQNSYPEATVMFVNKKNTVQSKIYFYAQGNSYIPKEEAVVEMFNSYFGGGFSGLVLKEIREYRSMAYSAGAVLRRPYNFNSNYTFTGYIGTQADKTIDAIDVFMNLVREMPEKPQEAVVIKEYLQLSLFSKVPGFRNISSRYVYDKMLGWDENPLSTKSRQYTELEFRDIVLVWNAYLKTKPMTIMIVADKKRVDVKNLTKYGKIRTIKLKNLYTK